jgi:hypothetical protein
MNKDELLEAANEWYEQDKSNRVVFHVTAEVNSNGDIGIGVGVGGEDTFLGAAICSAIEDYPELYNILAAALKVYKQQNSK